MKHEQILITGATGLTGSAAIRHLLSRGRSVRAMAHREDDRSKALQDLGVEVVYGDFQDHGAVKAALQGIKAAYFCYPITHGLTQATAQFAQAAKQNGVEAIVNMSQKIAREDAVSHASFEHWLSERVFDWTGLCVTHLRPPFFAEWLLFLAPMIRQGQVFAPYTKGKTAFVTAEDQGRVIATILENPEPHRGKTYDICGPEELSFQEAVQMAGRTLGKTIEYHVVPFAAMQENIASNSVKSGKNNALSGYGESNQPNGSAEPHIFQHLRAAYEDFENGLFRGLNDDIERITKTPPMTVDQFVAGHHKAFVQ